MKNQLPIPYLSTLLFFIFLIYSSAYSQVNKDSTTLTQKDTLSIEPIKKIVDSVTASQSQVTSTKQSNNTKDSTVTDSIERIPKKSKTVSKGKYLTNPIQEYNEAYFILNRLNQSIGLPPNEFNFQSPQATLEHFIISARNQNFKEASYALNLNLLPNSTTPEDAAILAEKLFFVINQRVRIDWSSVSDRPDGQVDISTATNKGIAGKPRRSVVFGEVQMKERDVVLRMQRVKYKDYGAFWVISANTVENIDALYNVYGPRKLDKMLPEWARIPFLNMPIWKLIGTLILILLSYFIARLTSFLIRYFLKRNTKQWATLVSQRLIKPASFTIAVLFFYILLNELISFAGPLASTIYSILLIVVISAIAWLIMRAIDAFMLYIAEHKIGDANPEENTDARMMLTYISVARRLVTFIVIIATIWVILSQFRSLERLGISLLASAGLATVILGIAAQSTLGNIIAGIQIALTRPARIGDTVIINDDWGYVEDIRFTYMVVRTWDLRRLVVPLKKIISETFENWSMTSAEQIRPIILYADYRIDVDKVRDKFMSLVKKADTTDEDSPAKVQVVDVTEKAIKIRALCVANDASATWDLHCELREKMIRFIADLEDGKHLSQQRIHFKNTLYTKESDA